MKIVSASDVSYSKEISRENIGAEGQWGVHMDKNEWGFDEYDKTLLKMFIYLIVSTPVVVAAKCHCVLDRISHCVHIRFAW